MSTSPSFPLSMNTSNNVSACVSSIIRITYIPAMLTSPDSTYVISGAMYWSVIETNVGIFAASIPSFKAIASRFLPRLIGEYTSQKKYGPWSNTIALGTMNRSDGEDAFDTRVNTGFGGNSSEERIIVPEGKILTQTHISTNVEVTEGSPPDNLSFERRR